MQMWNAQNASHIHTASTAATWLNPMPNQDSTNNLPDFQCCWKVNTSSGHDVSPAPQSVPAAGERCSVELSTPRLRPHSKVHLPATPRPGATTYAPIEAG